MAKITKDNNPANGESVAKSNKSRKLMTDALMLALNREVASADGVPTKRLNIIADKLAEKAAEGDVVAIKEVFDRTEGKAVQAVKHTGKVKHAVLWGCPVSE